MIVHEKNEARASQSVDVREITRKADRLRKKIARGTESTDSIEHRREMERLRSQKSRMKIKLMHADLKLEAFNYKSDTGLFL